MSVTLSNISKHAVFYGKELLSSRPTLKLKDHPLSVVLISRSPHQDSEGWDKFLIFQS